MLSLLTALSGLKAHRIALEVAGNNIANASTPGYHRQQALLAPTPDLLLRDVAIGTGVDVQRIRRVLDRVVEENLLAYRPTQSSLATTLNYLQQIQAVLAPTDGKLNQLIDRFLADYEQLSNRPDDLTLRRSVVARGVELSQQFQALWKQLSNLREIAAGQISSTVQEINHLSQQIAELNLQIAAIEVQGRDTNNLKDRRDALLEHLAQRTAIRVLERPAGQVDVLVGGFGLVSGTEVTQLAPKKLDDGTIQVVLSGTNQEVPIPAGSLAALLQVHNSVLPTTLQELDELAAALVREIDSLHASGIGLSGSFDFLVGLRRVSDPNLPLQEAAPEFSWALGKLYVTVTDKASGDRKLYAIDVDPSSMSLNDLAAALSSIPELTALVNPTTYALQLVAAEGYVFDFTGRFPQSPDDSGITGTARPTIRGAYTGEANNLYRFVVEGTGVVGSAASLTLRVEDADGNVVERLNVGSGYAPGDFLTLPNGVRVALSPGTLNAGDTFEVPLIADPDTSGVLVAVGLNSFFVGRRAADLSVRPDLLSRPQQLAASRTGSPGDGWLARRIAGLRDQLTLGGGAHSLSSFFVQILTDVGASIQQLEGQKAHQEAVIEQLEFQRQSISGVEIEEEVIRMVEFQRGFQAAAQVLRVVNAAMDELFRVL
jgi:flagellar hook-associated protein 1 FlgK